MEAEPRTEAHPRPPPRRLVLADLREAEPDHVSDVEALSVVLGGTVTTLARAAKALEHVGSVAELARLGHGELAALVGKEGARRLSCALVLGRRAARPPVPVRVDDASAVSLWARARLAYLEHEELWLLALDGQNRVRAARCLARGGAHAVSLRAKDVLSTALRENARGIVLVHNHPSGDPTPSDADARFTMEIAESAAIVGVPLLDHVVVAGERFASVPFIVDPR